MPPTRSNTRSQKKNIQSTYPPFSNSTLSDVSPVQNPMSPAPRRPTRSGLTSFNDVYPIGFPQEHNMCYRNAALSLLMNIKPFVRYLDQFASGIGNQNDNVLLELGDMANAYWSPGSDDERREQLSGLIDNLWSHLLHLNYDESPDTAGWGPFLDSDQLETQQDAGDFLENLLVNGDAECRGHDNDRHEYRNLIESTFQIHTTCAGNCLSTPQPRSQLDRSKIWTVSIDHTQGRDDGTLESAIATTLTNSIDLTCRTCKHLLKEGATGLITLHLHDAPTVLFIRIARFQRSKRGRLYKKSMNRVLVPEILDLTPHLSPSTTSPQIEAKYRLCGAINHAGTLTSGHFVTHIRHPGSHHHYRRQWYRIDNETVTPSSLSILNDDPVKFGRRRFTPYILAYTKIEDEDLPATITTPIPSPPKEKDIRFRIRISIPNILPPFTMSRRLRAFDLSKGAREMELGMEIVDAERSGKAGGEGKVVLRVDPIVFRLVDNEVGEGEGKRGRDEGDGGGEAKKPKA